MPKQSAQYNSVKTTEIAEFTDQLREHSNGANGTFDSAATADFISSVENQSGMVMPDILRRTLDSLPKGTNGEDVSPVLMKGILDGVAAYERAHGTEPTADVIESALHQAYATTPDAAKKYSLDSANSMNSDPISLQPNRAVIAIMAAMAEAIPVANYLPTDIGSNEAKLIIVSHTAGNAYGGYALNANMDGIASGAAYVTSQRTHMLTRTVDAFGDLLTAIQTDPDHCNQAGTAIKLLRGRTNIYINGYLAATEVSGTGSASASPISGTITIGSTDYAVSGSANVDTGAIAVTTTPALPANTPVMAEGFIDYERSPGTIPRINTSAYAYRLFASPWKVNTEQSIDTRTQFANELGLDPSAESMLAVRNQAANERHYDVLRKAARLGLNNQTVYDFAFSSRSQQMNRSQIWRDFAAVLGAVSQKMAEDTIDHGITHLYVSKNVMANMLGLEREIFEPSGVTNRPGIFRIGRLFSLYEVYYSPYVSVDISATASTIVCIGRSTQVARCPFVLGDAVPPTVNQLPYNRDQVAGSAFYARQFTSVNPHLPSAKGCAIINVINLS